MKINSCSLGLILGLALAPLALAAPAQRGPAAGGPNSTAGNDCTPGSMACAAVCDASCPGVCATVTADTTPLALGTTAQAALLFQIDEERMARELYTAFGAKWGLQPYAQIPTAEARHEAVLRQLVSRAGIAAPTAATGRFDSEEVQKRYDALLALGLESADSALRASAFVEEQDIADLQALIATTDNLSLQQAATALKTASGHHLNAFVGVLAARGITYEPKVLNPDEFEAIVVSASRGMGRGRGRGPGRA